MQESYSTGSEYQGAIEAYYTGASRYIACLDRFVGEIEARYAAEMEEMLRRYHEQRDAELADYAAERADIMVELGRAVQEHAAATVP